MSIVLHHIEDARLSYMLLPKAHIYECLGGSVLQDELLASPVWIFTASTERMWSSR